MESNTISIIVETILAQAAMQAGAEMDEALLLAKEAVERREAMVATPRANLEMIAEVREEVRRRLRSAIPSGQPSDRQHRGDHGDGDGAVQEHAKDPS